MINKATVKFIVTDTDKEITMNFELKDENILDYNIDLSESFKEQPANEPCLAFYLSQVFVDALTAAATPIESNSTVESTDENSESTE